MMRQRRDNAEDFFQWLGIADTDGDGQRGDEIEARLVLFLVFFIALFFAAKFLFFAWVRLPLTYQ